MTLMAAPSPLIVAEYIVLSDTLCHISPSLVLMLQTSAPDPPCHHRIHQAFLPSPASAITIAEVYIALLASRPLSESIKMCHDMCHDSPAPPHRQIILILLLLLLILFLTTTPLHPLRLLQHPLNRLLCARLITTIMIRLI